MKNLRNIFVYLLLINVTSSDAYAQPGTRFWDENISVRLQFEKGTTYYGHSEMFSCDSLPEQDWVTPGDFDNRLTFGYLLDSLKVGQYSLIKFSKGLDTTHILVKCDYKIIKPVGSTSHLSVILTLPKSGYYFIDLDSLRTNRNTSEYFQVYQGESSLDLYHATDITPYNWEDYLITEEEYYRRINEKETKKCFLRRRTN